MFFFSLMLDPMRCCEMFMLARSLYEFSLMLL